MAVKECRICGREFDGGGNEKVCPECHWHVCPICGRRFELTQYKLKQVMAGKEVSCSGKCRAELTKRRLLESEGIENVSQRESVNRSDYVRTCAKCGVEFRGSRASKYCDECRTATCPVCGKEMLLSGPKLTRYIENGTVTCGDPKCRVELTRRNLLEDEGVENVSQRPESREKIRQTRLDESEETKSRRSESLREACSRPDAIERRKRTMVERHGYESVMQDPEFHAKMVEKAASPESREKAKKTFSSNHDGAETPFQMQNVLELAIEKNHTRDALEKKRKTSIERHGKPNPLCNDTEQNIRDYLEEHPTAPPMEIAKAIGASYDAVTLQNRSKSLGVKTKGNSWFESTIAQYLDSLGVSYVRHDRKLLDGKELDFYVPDRHVAIEVNDFLTHNSTWSPYGDPKPKQYHWEKTRMCSERGVRLIHAWEHCLPGFEGEAGRLGSWNVMRDVIEHALGLSPRKVYARKTKVVEFRAHDLIPFFDANNINGMRNAKTAYCLVPKGCDDPTPDDVLMAYAVGRAHFGKGAYDAEIARGACRLGTSVVGGASKLWKHIIDRTDYQSIVYYVDRNYYDAQSMSFLDGVEYVRHSDSFWNWFPGERKLKNRDPKHNREITRGYRDHTVWMVNNAGTDTYVWRRHPVRAVA